jgi:hypothetical protein
MSDQTTTPCSECHANHALGADAGIFEGMCEACASAQVERAERKALAQASKAQRRPRTEKPAEPPAEHGGNAPAPDHPNG